MEIGDELEADVFNTFMYPTVHSAPAGKPTRKHSLKVNRQNPTITWSNFKSACDIQFVRKLNSKITQANFGEQIARYARLSRKRRMSYPIKKKKSNTTKQLSPAALQQTRARPLKS